MEHVIIAQRTRIHTAQNTARRYCNILYARALPNTHTLAHYKMFFGTFESLLVLCVDCGISAHERIKKRRTILLAHENQKNHININTATNTLCVRWIGRVRFIEMCAC